MSSVTPLGNSPWLDGPAPPARSPLTGRVEADVAVVGAGIIGLTTALLLQRAGARVAVIEARAIAGATSGHTTAKLTSLQGLAYSKITSRRPDAASEYARANESGIDLIERHARELEIECSFRRLTNFTFTDSQDEVGDIESECAAAEAAGLAVRLVDETPLPFSILSAVALDEQAQFDPVPYLRGLADALDAEGQSVYENSRVASISGDGVRTADGAVAAERVVLATQLPILDHLGLFGRAEPVASYSITAPIERPIEGMYMDASESWSIRGLEHNGEQLALVGGQGNRIGTGDPRKSIAALSEYAAERLDAAEVRHTWEAHDYVSEDHLPFVGRVTPLSDQVLTATGMSKWGLALGSACAAMLADAIGGGEEAWPDAFDSRRLPRPRAVPTLAKHSAETAKHLIGDRLKRASADELEPGEGAVVGAGLEQRAAYRGADGELTELSARCTHMGCIVAWNPVASTWDCPCHGSRFGIDGEVITGPAVRPLERKDD
jgi:glycine/D-amino acid oxidase-like deaminating enzyme/nitrite reductase/ring-hydroxylating ferredoxin subunit